MKLLVKNGTLVTGGHKERRICCWSEGRIVRVAPHLEDSGEAGAGRRRLPGVSRLYRRPHPSGYGVRRRVYRR